MKLLDGKKIAHHILARTKKEIEGIQQKPHLAVILVGSDKASELYVNIKKKRAGEIGITVSLFRFPQTVEQKEILAKINELNHDENVQGILVQLPLPHNLDTNRIMSTIDPRKDVDGFHPENRMLFLEGKSCLESVFVKAITILLESAENIFSGKTAIVIGNATLFFTLLDASLARKGIATTFISCADYQSSQTDLRSFDIVISACGKKNMLTGSKFKNDAIVIDGGIVKEGNKIFGDVDQESCEKTNISLSPVPGGVGPVTVACLLENVLLAQKKKVPR